MSPDLFCLPSPKPEAGELAQVRENNKDCLRQVYFMWFCLSKCSKALTTH